MKKIIVSLILLLIMELSLTACGKNSVSIGIIGGADGPTEMFVTSDSGKYIFPEDFSKTRTDEEIQR